MGNFGSTARESSTDRYIFHEPCREKDCVSGRRHAEAVNKFCFGVFRKLSEQGGNNYLFSPFSCYTCLAMSVPIFDGETRRSVLRVLGLEEDLSDEDCMQSLKTFIGYEHSNVKCYSRIWANKEKTLPGSMFEHQRSAGICIEESRFDEALVNKINNEVKKATNGEIKNIFKNISDMDCVILVNAIFFKSSWDPKFSQLKTRQEWRCKGTRVPCSFIKCTDEMYYGETPDFQIVEIPYKRWHYAMVIWLPKRDDNLPPFDIGCDDFCRPSGTYLAKVTVVMPEWDIDLSIELSGIIGDLGAHIFGECEGKCGRNISVSEMRQMVKIKVDKEGTTAAAATMMVIADGAPLKLPKKKFIADHPFMYAIVNTETRSIIFIGYLYKP